MQPLGLFVLKHRHRGCIYLCNHSNMNLLSGSNMKGVSIYEYFFESNKGKHFTLSDRISIEAGIEKGWSFKKIADELGKSPSSVSREVRRHLIFSPHYYDDHSRRKTECIYFLPAPNRASAVIFPAPLFALSVEAGNALLLLH